MNFLESLADYYDTEAEKFHNTRQRHWPEFDVLAEEIKARFKRKKKIRVLELGCGSGRLYGFLRKAMPTKEFIYSGVDISGKLIDKAQEDYPEASWSISNMTAFLQGVKQESYDIIIAIASFHHLPSTRTRLTTANHIYRALSYDGFFFMTNRSDSAWFRKRFRSSILLAARRSIISFGIYRARDLFLPWKSDKLDKTFYRYYHIFSLKELANIGRISGFGEIKQFFITSDGEKTQEKKNSRNSCSVRGKDVFLDDE